MYIAISAVANNSCGLGTVSSSYSNSVVLPQFQKFQLEPVTSLAVHLNRIHPFSIDSTMPSATFTSVKGTMELLLMTALPEPIIRKKFISNFMKELLENFHLTALTLDGSTSTATSCNTPGFNVTIPFFKTVMDC